MSLGAATVDNLRLAVPELAPGSESSTVFPNTCESTQRVET